ncbi:MAG: tripartite tricarboxylate transporter substrate binding protein [Pseudorhodoferax sp.]
MDFPPNRRSFLGLAAATGLALHLPARAAEAWPTRTVRTIVPFAPGGGADASARVLAELLGARLGQSVIVENKPGAGSAIGVLAAAQSRDGHTLLMASNSMLINPAINPQLGYDPVRDFDAIGMVSAQPLVLVVPAGSPARTMADLVAQAKASGPLTAGNSGTGTLAHLASEIFAGQNGIAITPVAYKGESALLPEMISGLIAFGFLNLPSVAPHIQSGRLRALAVSAPQPVPELPGVPTLRALGQPALEVQGWAALLAPKGQIPAEGLARLEGLLAQALASDTVKARFAAIKVTPFGLNRAATAQFLQAETSRYAAVVQARGIKAE